MSLHGRLAYISGSLKNRPIVVLIISIFYWLNALVLGFIGITVILAQLGSLPSLNGSGEKPSNYLLSLSLSVGATILAIVLIVVGWRLLQLKPQARQAAIILSGIVIVPNLFIFIVRMIYGQFSIPFSVIFHALVIWALYSKNVKAAFQPHVEQP